MRRSFVGMPEVQEPRGGAGMPGIDLDWEAYYRRFCGLHGDPVPYKGRLLFADGWTYSSTDYGGPEWPPPDDPLELRSLARSYWRRRLTVVEQEASGIVRLLDGLKETQSAKSVPLQVSIVAEEVDDAGNLKAVRRARDFDPGLIAERLRWLEEDIADCRQRLKEIDDGRRQRPQI